MDATGVPTDIQQAVDRYLELYQVYKQLEERLKSLRPDIETYMVQHERSTLVDTAGIGRVQLVATDRASVSARYTTYDLDTVCSVIGEGLTEKCAVKVIDKERLEAMVRTGEVPDTALQRKMTKSSTSFVVRLGHS